MFGGKRKKSETSTVEEYYFGNMVAYYAKEQGIVLTTEEIQRLTDWQGTRFAFNDPDPTKEEALQAVLEARSKSNNKNDIKDNLSNV